MLRSWHKVLVGVTSLVTLVAAVPGAVFAASPAAVHISGSALLGSWVPIPALDAALSAAGWGATWDAVDRRWSLTTPSGLTWRRPSGAVPTAAAGSFTVVLDGTAIGALPPMAMVDPLTGTRVPYLTLDAVSSLLDQVGLASVWTPADWQLRGSGPAPTTGPASTAQGGSATAPPVLTTPTLVGVAGQRGAASGALSVVAAAAPRGVLTASVPAGPLGVSLQPAQAEGPAVAGQRRWLLPFTVQVSAALPPGQVPLTLIWTASGVHRVYHAVLALPAVALAEQSGLYMDNLLGHHLFPAGGFPADTDAGGVVFDPLNQRIYASDPVHNRIQVYTTSGRLVQTIDPVGLHDPTFLALDATGGRLFVGNDGSSLVQLTLTGEIVPFAHTPFHAIFAQGDGMAFDPANGDLYVTRSLSSTQAASGAAPVVVYSTRSGERVHPSGGFPGIGSFASVIAYDPADAELYVGGERTAGTSPTAFVAAYTPAGQRVSGATAFPEGPANGEHAYGLVYDPLNGEILVLGDTNLHAFTASGDAVPPVTSQTTDSGTTMAAIQSGVAGIALIY